MKVIVNGRKLKKKNIMTSLMGNWDYKFETKTGTIIFKNPSLLNCDGLKQHLI
jgi:hypothetical protein